MSESYSQRTYGRGAFSRYPRQADTWAEMIAYGDGPVLFAGFGLWDRDPRTLGAQWVPVEYLNTKKWRYESSIHKDYTDLSTWPTGGWEIMLDAFGLGSSVTGGYVPGAPSTSSDIVCRAQGGASSFGIVRYTSPYTPTATDKLAFIPRCSTSVREAAAYAYIVPWFSSAGKYTGLLLDYNTVKYCQPKAANAFYTKPLTTKQTAWGVGNPVANSFFKSVEDVETCIAWRTDDWVASATASNILSAGAVSGVAGSTMSIEHIALYMGLP